VTFSVVEGKFLEKSLTRVCACRHRQEEKVGPNARIKIRVSLADIYTGI
jgi:hypothetical protein